MTDSVVDIPPPEMRLPPDLVRTYDLSFLSAENAEDPYDVLIPRIHEGPDLFYDPKGALDGSGAWIFRREADIRAGFLDEEHFTSQGAVGVFKLIGSDAGLIPAEIDPPDHAWYRAIMNPMFSPKRMAALEDVIEREGSRLIDNFRKKGECEFVDEFAVPLPVGIFLSLLGLSLDEMDTYVHWEKTMLGSRELDARIDTLQSMVKCLDEAMQDRVKNPRDDVLSHLVTAEIRGRRMTPDERVRSAVMLFFAGLDTVTSALSWHIKYLAEHPEDQQLLRTNPDLLDSATEELLRAFAPLTVNKRCKKRFVSANGIVIEPGERILLSAPIANRDPEVYPDPNRIIMDRGAVHGTFAYGVHRCIGSHLARREILVSLRLLLSKLPEFRRANNDRLPMRFGSVLALKELPIVWDA